MASGDGARVLSDAQRALLEPLVLAARPRGKTPHADLRRTIEAIVWRCANGAKRRSIPAGLGPRWGAAQTFIRRARLGVRKRLLSLAQERAGGAGLRMVFVDGANVRAHAKAAGAPKKGGLRQAETSVRRLAALVAATAPRL